MTKEEYTQIAKIVKLIVKKEFEKLPKIIEAEINKALKKADIISGSSMTDKQILSKAYELHNNIKERDMTESVKRTPEAPPAGSNDDVSSILNEIKNQMGGGQMNMTAPSDFNSFANNIRMAADNEMRLGNDVDSAVKTHDKLMTKDYSHLIKPKR